MAKGSKFIAFFLVAAFLVALRFPAEKHIKLTHFNFHKGKRVFIAQPIRGWGILSPRLSLFYARVHQMRYKGELRLRQVQEDPPYEIFS